MTATHPVLTDPALSVPVVLYTRTAGGTEERIQTRGVVQSDSIMDDATNLGGLHGLTVDVPDPMPVGTDYRESPVRNVDVPSLGLVRYRVVAAEPSGAALGSTGVDWRKLTLRLQKGD